MIEIDLVKLIGTGRTKVPVTRKSGTTMEYRRTGKKTSGRVGTGKIDKLPDNIKKEIIELRNIRYSGAKIKENIETMIDIASDEVKEKLRADKVINDQNKLTVTAQGLTDWAKKRGAEGKTRKTVTQVEKEKDKEWTEKWNKLNDEKSRLTVELRNSEDNAEAQRTQKLRIQERLSSCRSQLLQEKGK